MIIAVISCGSIGQRHISNFVKFGFRVIGFNRSIVRSKYVEKKFKIKVFSNLKHVIDQRPDLAIICSPNSMHLEHAILFAKNKINIFIEKPLCALNQNTSRLSYLIKKYKLFNHVGCNLRFNKGIKILKKILDENQIGDIINAEFFTGMYLPDWHPYENYKKMYSSKKKLGGGVLMDMTHELDLATWFFGDLKKTTSILKKSPYLKTETTNVANIIVEFKNKTTVYFNLNYFEKPYRREIKIFGSNGKVSLDLIKCNLQLFYGNKKITKNYSVNYNHNKMYIDQNKYVIKKFKEQKSSFNDVLFSKKIMNLAKAIQKSNIIK